MSDEWMVDQVPCVSLARDAAPDSMNGPLTGLFYDQHHDAYFRASVIQSLLRRKTYDIATDTVRDMTEAEVTATRAWLEGYRVYLEGIPHAQ